MFEPARTRIAVICSGCTSCVDHQPPHRVHRRMAEHAARIRLDRDAGPHDRVRVPELADDAIGVEAVAVAEYLEEAPRRIERILAAGEAARGQLRGDDAVLRGAAHVQRLGHGAEVHANAGRRACGDRQRVRGLAGVEPQQLGRRGRRAEGADRAGGMEAFLVVTRMNRLGDLALDFEAGQERLEKFRARHALPLADGERGRQRRHGRMRQQPEDAVGARGELRIVPVERVAARAVEQRRRRRAGAECGSGPNAVASARPSVSRT